MSEYNIKEKVLDKFLDIIDEKEEYNDIKKLIYELLQKEMLNYYNDKK